MGRRAMLAGLFVSPLVGSAALARVPGLTARLATIEATTGGRLGVAMLDTATGEAAGYRADERFPMCSTFKLLVAAMTLHRAGRLPGTLDAIVPYGAADLIAHSPVTARHVATGLTVRALCHATMTESDNAAANLLLARLGGPAALTRFVRGLGDRVTRLDRIEPVLNEARPGDPRDTTSPAAMLATMHRLLLGPVLSTPGRATLTGWLVANRTGDTRLRAGVPTGWTVGDKTGAGENGTTCDIGIFWPPGRAPILMTAYLTGATVPTEARNAALAAAARAVIAALPPPGGRG
ncbi:class A beta-lactamase [Sphingomonas solaris]